jgi:type I restriction enzyme R subunit
LNLKKPGEYELFTVLRAHALSVDETYLAQSARQMVDQLRSHQLLMRGWSNTRAGRMVVEQSLLVESWKEDYAAFGFDPADPSFLKPAIEELAKVDI